MTLQELCTARGLTLEQLAARADVALITLTKLDAGTIRANPFILRRLADALGLEPGALRDELSAVRRRLGPSPTGRHSAPWR